MRNTTSGGRPFAFRRHPEDASGTKPYVDICIPEADACNLGGFMTKGAMIFQF
ncbi:MAG: hypothetical protein IPK98_19595 [Chloracidobacterium sp.]|nr:hypothetical protein [Chloracidobacterium sp.]